jgi:hypothetical protein
VIKGSGVVGLGGYKDENENRGESMERRGGFGTAVRRREDKGKKGKGQTSSGDQSIYLSTKSQG